MPKNDKTVPIVVASMLVVAAAIGAAVFVKKGGLKGESKYLTMAVGESVGVDALLLAPVAPRGS